MTTYNWKIEAVDTSRGTMLVEFTHDDVVTMMNLSTPPEGVELAEWVDKFAPRHQWAQATPASVVVGATGQAVVELPVAETPAPSEAPQQSLGNVNEEYLRALIFQVLEEIQESTVEPPAPAPAPAPV